MASNADIIVEILPIEQAQLQIELKIYEKLLKLFYENSEIEYNNTHGQLEFNVNKVLPYLLKEISQLKTKLENYKPKQHTITAPISKPASAESIEGLSL